MFGRLLPTDSAFFDLFQEHAALTAQGTRDLQALILDGVHPAARAKRIQEIEHETDVITHRCVEALHRTFITPIDRDDIHRLITRMDDVMDFVEAAADRLALYEIDDTMPGAGALAGVRVRAADEVARALGELRHKKSYPAVLERCIEINRLENEGDDILRNALARLFREQKDAIRVMKWKEVLENLESAIDRCEDVANILEGLILEAA